MRDMLFARIIEGYTRQASPSPRIGAVEVLSRAASPWQTYEVPPLFGQQRPEPHDEVPVAPGRTCKQPHANNFAHRQKVGNPNNT